MEWTEGSTAGPEKKKKKTACFSLNCLQPAQLRDWQLFIPSRQILLKLDQFIVCKLLHVSPQQEAGSKASSSRKRSSIWSSSISSSLFYFWPTLTFWLMSGEGDSAPVSSKFAATKPLLRWEEWFTATSLVESYLYHHLLANGYLEASCYFRSENGWPLLWFGFI